MFSGFCDADLWSAASLESLIISSGQSVWHSAVAFQSPLRSPMERNSSLPPPPGKVDQSEHTCLYLFSSLYVIFLFFFFLERAKSNIRLLADANTSINESF